MAFLIGFLQSFLGKFPSMGWAQFYLDIPEGTDADSILKPLRFLPIDGTGIRRYRTDDVLAIDHGRRIEFLSNYKCEIEKIREKLPGASPAVFMQ